MGNADAVRFTNCLAEDEIVIDRLPQRQHLLIQSLENVQAVQPLGRVDAGKLKGLDLEQHAKQKHVGAEHKRRVEDNLWDVEHVASGPVSGTWHTAGERDRDNTHASFKLRKPLVNSAVSPIKIRGRLPFGSRIRVSLRCR